jgi:hypothetical protein
MQDSGYELRRKPLLGTWVNKGKEKGQGVAARLGHTRDRRVRRSLLSYSTFAVSVGKGGGVRIFLEPRHFPITHGEHVGEVTLPISARGLDVPCIMPKRHDPIILGYEISWLELPDLLDVGKALKELSYLLTPPQGTTERRSFYLGGHPLDILGKRVEHCRDISALKVVVGLLHKQCIFLFAHGLLLLSDPPLAEAGQPFLHKHDATDQSPVRTSENTSLPLCVSPRYISWMTPKKGTEDGPRTPRH